MCKKNNNLLLLIIIFYILVNFYNQNFIYTDSFYQISIGFRLTSSQIEEYLTFRKKIQWLTYVFVPIVVFLRISFSWVCLKTGSLVTELFLDIHLWKICIQAEIMFAIGTLARLLYMESTADVKTIEQLLVNPFSLYVFTFKSMPSWSAYFFNSLNFFDLIYVLFIAYLIARESKKTLSVSLGFVSYTYLPGLFLWVLFMSYLSIAFQS